MSLSVDVSLSVGAFLPLAAGAFLPLVVEAGGVALDDELVVVLVFLVTWQPARASDTGSRNRGTSKTRGMGSFPLDVQSCLIMVLTPNKA